MADPGSITDEQNEQMKAPEHQQTQSRDWRTAYCRLKEEGDDDISGEEERERDWCWQQSDGEQHRNPTTQLSASGSKVLFHPTYSSGTAFVLGSIPLSPPHNHFWEVTVDSPVYGTDVMVGVATDSAPLATGQRSYCSLLGREAESWGWSYQGYTQHGGRQQKYGTKWGQGDRLGVHFDAWRGTLEFYLNRKPLGVAFTNLRGKTVFPVICSTAAKSSLTLSTARSLPSSLQFLAVRSLAHKLPGSTLLSLLLPPGIRNFIRNNYWFFIDHSSKPTPFYAPVTPCISTSSNSLRTVAPDQLGKKGGEDTETEDEDCFLVTPEGRKEAKEALMAKCVALGEQNKRGRTTQKVKKNIEGANSKAVDKNLLEKEKMGTEETKKMAMPVGEGETTEEEETPPRNIKRFRLCSSRK